MVDLLRHWKQAGAPDISKAPDVKRRIGKAFRKQCPSPLQKKKYQTRMTLLFLLKFPIIYIYIICLSTYICFFAKFNYINVYNALKNINNVNSRINKRK